MAVIVVSALKDKKTKSKVRYNIKKNEKGVVGIVYLDQDLFEDEKPPKSIKIKVKVGDD